jgi:AmmeMemoRadiSam system protein A
MAWIWATLMPHPPIILPEVGRGREKDAAATLAGLEKLLSLLQNAVAGAMPDCLLALSPHQPHVPGALFLNAAAHMSGSFAPFGAPNATLALEGAPDALARLAAHLKLHDIPNISGQMEDITRDHGSLVPLMVLSRRFDKLPPVILASPIGLTPQEALKLGQALATFQDDRNWALLASGDLSHRLTPDAPAGFNQAGKPFDEAVVQALRTGDPGLLGGLSDQIVSGAGECGLRSVMTLLGLVGGPLEVLSYEGPFGVGYCTAFKELHGNRAHPSFKPSPGKPGRRAFNIALRPVPGTPQTRNTPPPQSIAVGEAVVDPGHPYPRLARLAVSRHLASPPGTVAEEEARAISVAPSLWTERKACFVSIKTKAGVLRGCIGTILPTRANLCMEIIGNAVAAATQDSRFPAMISGELSQVTFSVDVLSLPEPVADPKELDPAVWGVIVSKGNQRGLLLPALEGVNTVEQQIAIAAHKGGIKDVTGAVIQRFSVTRFKEE